MIPKKFIFTQTDAQHRSEGIFFLLYRVSEIKSIL